VSDADRRVVANSVEALEALDREELLDLVRIFAAHPNNRIRANAAKALWTMGDRQARTLLDEMLADPDEMMRLSATWLLGEIDHPLRIELLTKLSTTDPAERVRAKALNILGEGA
jgi:HEAT repeat protein